MMTQQEAGHTFLAKLGKKRLRPGGKKATDFLLTHIDFNNKNVLEVACNMATTAIEIAKQYNCQITGVDLDAQSLKKAENNVIKNKLQDKVVLMQANAAHLPFDDNSFDVVINEAMLTMHTDVIRNKCINEYYRVLKPGGYLLTHDVALLKLDHNLINNLSNTINVKVNPVTVDAWIDLFKKHHFKVADYMTGHMSLMNPIGMIKDEGFVNTCKIITNALKKENFPRFKRMFSFFKANKQNLNFIAIVSQK